MNAKRAQAKANAAAGRKTRATKRETPAPPYERELEPVLVDSPAPPPTAPAPYHRELAEQAVAKPNTPTPFERALVDEAETKPTAMPPFERALADKTVATATVSPKFQHEVVDALTSLSYKPAEARRAVDNIADNADPTFEGRLRAALVSLSRSRPIRCSDGELDLSAGLLLWIALRDCVHRERPLSACRTGATGGRGPRPFTTGYVWPAKTAHW